MNEHWLRRISFVSLIIVVLVQSNSFVRGEPGNPRDTRAARVHLHRLVRELKQQVNEGDIKGARDTVESLQTMLKQEPVSEPSARTSTRDSSLNPAVLPLGPHEVRIYHGGPLIYIIGESPKEAKDRRETTALLHHVGKPDTDYVSNYRFSSQLPVAIDGRRATENKYIKLDGATKVVKFASSDSRILKVGNGPDGFAGLADEQGRISVADEGDVAVSVSVDDKTVTIQFHIVQLPIRADTSRDALIQLWGAPDKQTPPRSVSYPGEEIDSLLYTVLPGKPSLWVEHWLYKQYPEVILRMGHKGVEGIAMRSWDQVERINARLRYGRGDD